MGSARMLGKGYLSSQVLAKPDPGRKRLDNCQKVSRNRLTPWDKFQVDEEGQRKTERNSAPLLMPEDLAMPLSEVRNETGAQDWVKQKKGTQFQAFWSDNPNRYDFYYLVCIALHILHVSNHKILTTVPQRWNYGQLRPLTRWGPGTWYHLLKAHS